ncbi:hypothetical protein GCM10011617_30000 [Novosphingobium arvoryzae]|uniref:Uncharacterized protein n=1 Tax=Novosphingobium arvoryzae TaxID=1256514 RepID=A0A918RR35_9SPHN|nr:hypothetical protein GCM10011617_30000 [Novosphingobium arvoryzae]
MIAARWEVPFAGAALAFTAPAVAPASVGDPKEAAVTSTAVAKALMLYVSLILAFPGRSTFIYENNW